jgi:hypothetical protein
MPKEFKKFADMDEFDIFDMNQEIQETFLNSELTQDKIAEIASVSKN